MKLPQRICYIALYVILLVTVLLYQRELAYREIRTFEAAAIATNAVIVDNTSLEDFQVFYQSALTYSNSYNYESAVEDFYLAYRITQRYPSLLFASPQFLEDYHQALLNRSLIYLHQNKETLAIHDYELAMTLLPELYSTSTRCWLMRRLHCEEQSSRPMADTNTIPILVPQ